MEKLTKEQALQKIEELRNYVTNLDMQHPAELAIEKMGPVQYGIGFLGESCKRFLYPAFDKKKGEIVVFAPPTNPEWFFAATRWVEKFCLLYKGCYPIIPNNGQLLIVWQE